MRNLFTQLWHIIAKKNKQAIKTPRTLRSVFLYILKVSGIFLGTLIIFAGTNLFARCPVARDITYIRQYPSTKVSEATPYNTNRKTIQIPNYKRPEESTFLKLPEWFIVYSAHEYADCLGEHDPSNFPYMQSVFQYWDYYRKVNIITKKYNFNNSDHLVNVVIGVSYTFEYFTKAAYESSIGRVTELLHFGPPTEEEQFAQKVADEYADFLHMVPWYEFPFFEKLSGVWTDTSFFGPSFIRKFERKTILSAEYLGKGVYGLLISKATASVFSEEAAEIIAWTRTIPQPVREKHGIKVIETIDAESELVGLPRYELFTSTVLALAAEGIQFIEIAGNDEIMLTAIAPKDYKYGLSNSEVLFVMDIATHREKKRVIIKVPTQYLSSTIQQLHFDGVLVEHIYDF